MRRAAVKCGTMSKRNFLKPVYKNATKIFLLTIAASTRKSACGSQTRTKDLRFPAGTTEAKSMLEVGRQFEDAERQITDFLVKNGYEDFDNGVRLLDKTASAQNYR